MPIEGGDPFREAVSLRDAMNSLLRESFVWTGGAHAAGVGAGFPVDVSETEGEFVVAASLPGVKPGDVQVTVHGETVTISGEVKAEADTAGQTWHLRERRWGALHRSLTLGTPIDADRSVAEFEHGVLTLTLPKSGSARPRQIRVGRPGTAREPGPSDSTS
jgi:HSP20 family protein